MLSFPQPSSARGRLFSDFLISPMMFCRSDPTIVALVLGLILWRFRRLESAKTRWYRSPHRRRWAYRPCRFRLGPAKVVERPGRENPVIQLPENSTQQFAFCHVDRL